MRVGDEYHSTLHATSFAPRPRRVSPGGSGRGAPPPVRRKTDDARAVATPSVALSRTDAAVGSPVDMTYTFAVAATRRPSPRTTGSSSTSSNADGELMWTDDHQPPTPTRAVEGRAAPIEYTRTMFVPKFPYVGESERRSRAVLAASRATRLPLTGEDAGMRSYRVARSTCGCRPTTCSSSSRTAGTRLRWPGTAPGSSGSGRSRQGTLSFRNPKRDVDLFLQVDQPVDGACRSRSRSRSGSARRWSTRFALPPGDRELRRIPAHRGPARRRLTRSRSQLRSIRRSCPPRCRS